jgi:hypothetical protein
VDGSVVGTFPGGQTPVDPSGANGRLMFEEEDEGPPIDDDLRNGGPLILGL